MNATSKTYPPQGAWREPGCERCTALEQELRRMRAERNDLVVRVHELEVSQRGGSRRERRRTPLGFPVTVGAPPPGSSRQGMYLQDVSNHLEPAARATPRGSASAVASSDSGVSPVRSLRGESSGHGGRGATLGRDQGIDFGAVARLSPEELDGLPYGLITLDAEGRVVHYNDTEARLVGLPKERVIGRDFFAEVAPCTRVREFEGRFRALAADPSNVRVQSFDFSFHFQHSEQLVSIVITPARRRGHYHMALVRRSIKRR